MSEWSDAPKCFGCSHGESGGQRKTPFAEYLVGDRQGHVTLECAKHALMLLAGGASFAIPLSSLHVFANADELAKALGYEVEPGTHVRRVACPTYERGFTLDLERR